MHQQIVGKIVLHGFWAMKKKNPEEVGDGRRGKAHNVKDDDDMKDFIAETLGRNPAIT